MDMHMSLFVVNFFLSKKKFKSRERWPTLSRNPMCCYFEIHPIFRVQLCIISECFQLNPCIQFQNHKKKLETGIKIITIKNKYIVLYKT